MMSCSVEVAIALTAVSLSFYVDSTYEPPTCNGGSYLRVFQYVENAGGITYESAYPHNTIVLQCDVAKNDYAVTPTSWSRVEGQQAMIDYVFGGGTLGVVVDSSSMGLYYSGIYSFCDEDVKKPDHAVQIVGVNVEGG